MSYNTLKNSYPYPMPTNNSPYPKESLGIGGKDCKELGVTPGDVSGPGFRFYNQKLPKDLNPLIETFGNPNSRDKLNKTLLVIIKILHANNITNWFIGYGTLLGIVRENSCIDGDDDNDIICDINNYDKVKSILTDNGFTFQDLGSKYILKSEETANYSSVDFYMSEVDSIGNFKDKWENITWSNCYTSNNKLIEKEWNGSIIYLPNNFITKLRNIYGENWMKPQKTKKWEEKLIL